LVRVGGQACGRCHPPAAPAAAAALQPAAAAWRTTPPPFATACLLPTYTACTTCAATLVPWQHERLLRGFWRRGHCSMPAFPTHWFVFGGMVDTGAMRAGGWAFGRSSRTLVRCLAAVRYDNFSRGYVGFVRVTTLNIVGAFGRCTVTLWRTVRALHRLLYAFLPLLLAQRSMVLLPLLLPVVLYAAVGSVDDIAKRSIAVCSWCGTGWTLGHAISPFCRTRGLLFERWFVAILHVSLQRSPLPRILSGACLFARKGVTWWLGFPSTGCGWAWARIFCAAEIFARPSARRPARGNMRCLPHLPRRVFCSFCRYSWTVGWTFLPRCRFVYTARVPVILCACPLLSHVLYYPSHFPFILLACNPSMFGDRTREQTAVWFSPYGAAERRNGPVPSPRPTLYRVWRDGGVCV